jgi:hypothetical protein
LAQWFWRRSRKCKSLQTDRQTDAGQRVIRKAHLSFQLRWAKKNYVFHFLIRQLWILFTQALVPSLNPTTKTPITAVLATTDAGQILITKMHFGLSEPLTTIVWTEPKQYLCLEDLLKCSITQQIHIHSMKNKIHCTIKSQIIKLYYF